MLRRISPLPLGEGTAGATNGSGFIVRDLERAVRKLRKHSNHLVPAATFLLCLISAWLGWSTGSLPLLLSALLGLCYVLMRAVVSGRVWRRRAAARPADPPPLSSPRTVARARVDPNDTDGLVEQMLAEGRFALLLRRQVVGNLSGEQFRRTDVVLGRIDEALDDGKLEAEEILAARGRVIHVQRFFLDRYPVTNRQYSEFVTAGGYQQVTLWDPSILPAVLDFVDRTGVPGPRYWVDGCFAAGQEEYPVVGVSWYEASAYARWLGKRLPSDAEWVKAGSWPVPLSPTTREQRKYPWGETMDRSRANLWGSGPMKIAPVTAFPEGVSIGGVYQLIGNTWEWVGGDFRGADHPQRELALPAAMKSIRGGAFDTYFDNQATCQFQSGENPLHRRHNISFRCAVGTCDLVLARPAQGAIDEDAADEHGDDQGGRDSVAADRIEEVRA